MQTSARALGRTRILLQMDLRQKAARDVVGGTLRYASLHPDWDVRIARGHPANSPPHELETWMPNGIITDSRLKRSEIQLLATNGLSGIVFTYESAAQDPQVRGVVIRHEACDNVSIGEAGARFLLAKRLRHFAYVPSIIGDRSLERRKSAFVGFLNAHGRDVHVYRKAKARSGRPNDLSAWLLALPKPCGVMAAFDQRAKNVLDACRLADIDCPGQILVLGVDDEGYICENTIPTLSSILPDFQKAGYRAAEMLQAIFAGDTTVRQTDFYGARQIIERDSTLDIGGVARSVTAACNFMRRNAAAFISISDVAIAAGTSRRMLERNFQTVLGTTAAKELQRIRLDLVKASIAGTDTPLFRVGEACGFRDESHLKRLFRREVGMTMSAYREKSLSRL